MGVQAGAALGVPTSLWLLALLPLAGLATLVPDLRRVPATAGPAG